MTEGSSHIGRPLGDRDVLILEVSEEVAARGEWAGSLLEWLAESSVNLRARQVVVSLRGVVLFAASGVPEAAAEVLPEQVRRDVSALDDDAFLLVSAWRWSLANSAERALILDLHANEPCRRAWQEKLRAAEGVPTQWDLDGWLEES